MSDSQKRSSEKFETGKEQASKQQKVEEVATQVSTEDIEEAMYQVKQAAAKGRAQLVSKAKKLFKLRNGFECNDDELSEIFNYLRDQMMDEQAAQSSSDDEEELEDAEKEELQLAQLQCDIAATFEHVRDLGQAAGKKMKKYLKELWVKENNGGEPSDQDMEAVFYNLKHMMAGMVTVESGAEDSDDEEYEPSEEKDSSSSSDDDDSSDSSSEKESIGFDFKPETRVPEEQFEKLVEKFVEEKGRKPTTVEADALLMGFSMKLTTTKIDDDGSDYESEDSDESEDESLEEEDKSLNSSSEEDSSSSSEEDEEASAEEKSAAFTYMKELEEGDNNAEKETVEKTKPNEETGEIQVVA